MEEILERYSRGIKFKEMFYNLIRWKYKSIYFFGHKVRVPIKHAERFEDLISSLEVMLELTDIKFSSRSNHTLLEVSIYDKTGNLFVSLDFEFYFGPIVIVGMKYRQNSKLKSIKLYKKATRNIKGKVLFYQCAYENVEFHKPIELLSSMLKEI